ncbi:hypothetical protein B0H12DRAFT_1228862 [Mycena haematopus]|nr:hypothetical protein B0H12DRAFT_1228862 [Mycena haematopus]
MSDSPVVSPMSNSPVVSHIASLSRDVLMLICELAISGSSSNRSAVRCVCKLWRLIVDDEVTCSRDIAFHFKLWPNGTMDPELLRRNLQRWRESLLRARSASLDLTISINYPLFAAPSFPGSSLIPFPERIKIIVNTLYTLLSEAAPRTRSLWIEGLPEILHCVLSGESFPLHLSDIESDMRPTTVSWPKLRALAIYVSLDPSAVLGDCGSLRAPLLSSISTSYLTPTLLVCLPRPNIVSTVEIFDREQSCLRSRQTGASLHDFLRIIALFPLLEQLTIAVDDITDPLPDTSKPTTLPFLHRLHLSSSQPPSECSWNGPWMTSTLWSYIITPGLKELSVPQRWFEMGPIVELNGFFRRNSRVPALIQFIECPSHLKEEWRLRQQAAWPKAIVQVRCMPWAGPEPHDLGW